MYVIYRAKADNEITMIRSYWDNGKLQGTSYFVNNVRNGPWTRYFFSGSLMFEGSFSTGKKNGFHKYYYENGGVSVVEEYKLDNKISIVNYDSNGVVIQKN
jgi:antitoxin component YwqK of YwqJK toxin-antitoxin module